MIKDIYILKTQLLSELKSNTSQMRLGYLWWFLEPIFLGIIYYFLIHIIFGRGGEGYHIFILTGLVAWQGFGKGLQAGTSSIANSAPLIFQTKFPLEYLVIAPILANIFYMFIGLLIVSVMVGYFPLLGLVHFLIIVIIFAAFTYGIALILSVLNVYIRDTGRMLRFILRIWWFLSPVLYDLQRIIGNNRFPGWAKDLYMLNPFATFIPMIRDLFMNSTIPELSRLFFPLLFSLAMLIVGTAVFNMHKHKLVKYL